MPGGLAIAAASSAAWAEMGAQAERALNTGWVFDQRQDNAGGFLTNASPTSSGLTFQSTGNATAFYPIGRALQVVQAAGTAICTVGQSSFSGGITNVFLNQFSTQAGLSTALSTGAITSVAGSPIFPMSTQNNTFGGAVVVSATGGNASIAIGANPAGSGAIRIPNNVAIMAKAFGVGDDEVVRVLTNDVVQIAGAGGLQVFINSWMGFGTTPASSGIFRLPNSPIAIVSKTSTGGDDIVWPMQFVSTSLNADATLTTGAMTFSNVISKTLPVGTWYITAAVTAWSTDASQKSHVARIDDGVNVYASGGTAASVGGSTENFPSVVLSTIVSHTTALTYNLASALSPGGSTVFKAFAQTQGALASTAATYFRAVKIG